MATARIVTRGRGYELQLPDDDVDAVRFEHLVEERRAREALALWRGDPLADVADEPFAAVEIRRLEDLRLRAAEMAIDADLEAGRHAEVIAELEALVAQHPLRERLHSRRMLALYRSGRQSEALEAYRQARSALVEEIGVEPGAELRRLHDAILAQDPALDLQASADHPRQPSPRPGRAGWPAGCSSSPPPWWSRVSGVRRHPRRRGRRDAHRRERGRPDRPGERAHQESYAVGRSPAAVTVGAGSVWVANRLDGTVSRVDREPSPDEIVQIPVGGAPSALAFGAGSLWVADGDAREVAQVDPGAKKVLQRITVGNAPRSLAVTGAPCGRSGGRWIRAPDRPRHAPASPRSRSARSRPRSWPAPARSGSPARSPAR